MNSRELRKSVRREPGSEKDIRGKKSVAYECVHFDVVKKNIKNIYTYISYKEERKSTNISKAIYNLLSLFAYIIFVDLQGIPILYYFRKLRHLEVKQIAWNQTELGTSESIEVHMPHSYTTSVFYLVIIYEVAVNG